MYTLKELNRKFENFNPHVTISSTSSEGSKSTIVLHSDSPVSYYDILRVFRNSSKVRIRCTDIADVEQSDFPVYQYTITILD